MRRNWKSSPTFACADTARQSVNDLEGIRVQAGDKVLRRRSGLLVGFLIRGGLGLLVVVAHEHVVQTPLERDVLLGADPVMVPFTLRSAPSEPDLLVKSTEQ